ncbi:hypothetical protein QR680_015566 [Steinernema hermaphroditum]|uniref:Fatty-acid and retinol-binding protein 1 n=1 Tax=Steinernema hermaphroditum TaxID=289476 RepID=A0AA39LKZ7_9BILA|nr:hypothetical protein QR680_015566 [Steinernema hermaphroditum]
MFLLAACLLVFFASALARPENLVAQAFASDDSINFYNKVASVFGTTSGHPVNFHDFVTLAKSIDRALYEKLAVFETHRRQKEDALPKAVKKFIQDRRSEINDWFVEGMCNQSAFLRSLKLIDSDISAMTEADKAALFHYYPHIKTLLENPHYKKFVANPADNQDELEPILQK